MHIEKSKASQQEAEKLVEEMKTLIKRKGLKVDLITHAGARYGKPSKGGCTGCTVCPCMICW